MPPTRATGQSDRNPESQAGVNGMPMGRIKNLKISRLVSGGNLISGWSHSRDLIYVHSLMDHYNTPEKVVETLALLEENGVNTIIADPRKKPMDIFKKHWSQGGKIQWIAEGHPTPDDLKTNVKASVDWALRLSICKASSATSGSRKATWISSANASSTLNRWACRADSGRTCST